MKLLKSLVISFVLCLLLIWPVFAQQGDTYVVQTGDTLSKIALKYNISLTDLAAANNIKNPNLIIAGQRLVIPFGITTTVTATTNKPEQTYTVKPGDTLYEIAAQFGVRSARLAQVNGISDVNVLAVGQKLLIPSEQPVDNAAIPLPYPFKAINLSELQIAQGRTLVVSVTLASRANLVATFEDRPVFLTGDGLHYWGIVGIHAMSDIGVYSLAFTAVFSNKTESAVAQNVIVTAGPYGTETIEVISGRENLLDPAVTNAETEKLSFIWSQITPRKLWQGSFRYPLDEIRITSAFGTRRSYGGIIGGFHGGVDFGGNGVPIYAPAAGVVVLAEQLQVRGNAVMIDHGMGLFSGYWHQSQIAVQVGDQVAPGDIIGYVGDTGLVTGPHLHWEMRLGGIAVDPLQWVEETIDR